MLKMVMLKLFKYATALLALVTGAIGVYFYLSFKNIHFEIKNELRIPITTHLTIYSRATKKDYTYPLLAKEAIAAQATVETFYTIDKAVDGTECVEIIFRNEEGQDIKKYSCPEEGDTLIVK